MTTPAFAIETDPTPEQIQYLEDRLYEFNSEATGIADGQGLAIFVRDGRDRIVAGICGHTLGWLLRDPSAVGGGVTAWTGVGNEPAPGS